MILMIDNYDSFTYNLVQYLGQLGCDVAVHRNDEITLEEIEAMAPEAIFLSPGPCTPKEAGVTVEVIRRFHERIPIMGICLGHQAIGYAFGAEVVRADRLMHGKTSPVFNDGRTIFKGLPNPLTAGRYHSLLVQTRHAPGLPGGERRDGGRRGHGASPPPLPPGRGAISPRVGPHAERETNSEKLPGDGLRERERRVAS